MQNKFNFWWKVTTLIMGIGLFPTLAIAANSTQITYQGSLIALPCTIEPGQENQVVEMGEITAQALYRYTRTEGKTLYFDLKDCDPSIDNHINISLSGTTNADGLLAFAGNSEASGAGIGIEYLDGTPIVINSPDSLRVQVNKGDMTLRAKAYVQIESAAQQNHSLVAGRYNAILTYTFKYE